MEHDDPRIEISAIKTQLNSIQKSIDEVKLTVTHMAEVGTSVAVMEKQQTTHSDKLRELSDRVDNVENRLTTNSTYLNKLKGGIGLAMTLMTLIQGSVLAGAGWLLSTVIEAQEQLTSVQKSMHYIEMEQSRIIQAFLAATKEQK